MKKIEKRQHRHGFFRWIALALLVLTGLAAFFIPPVQPDIKAASAEVAGPLFSLPVIGDFYLTNSLIGMLLVDLIIVGLAWAIRKILKSSSIPGRSISGVIIAILEVLFNLTERTAGKWAKEVFPWFATITLTVLVANLLDLLPGIEGIGLLVPSVSGYVIETLIPGVLSTITRQTNAAQLYSLVTFVRSPSTDLNFTLALGLIAVISIQVMGLRYQGFTYLKRFFNVSTLFSKPGLGIMDFMVSLLELISEFAKIISFTFRLFGSIFAGMVLLALSGTLIPVIGQSGVMLFELFMGLIQALVFGLLTMVFMSQAIRGEEQEETPKDEQRIPVVER